MILLAALAVYGVGVYVQYAYLRSTMSRALTWPLIPVEAFLGELK